MKFIDHHNTPKIIWAEYCEAIRKGHQQKRAALCDQFLGLSNGTLMARSAAITGIGSGVKTFTVIPENASYGIDTVQGAMIVFDEATGTARAIINSSVITTVKTVADSMVGCQLLANPDPKSVLIVGAGTIAANLINAYIALFPSIETIQIWNRTHANAVKLAVGFAASPVKVAAVENLAAACGATDIISCATLAHEPVIKGRWIKPGTHVDLIGAFKADMREADDALLQQSRIFVDSFETTIEHIGELKIPLANGTIKRDDVLGDLYDLVPGNVGRRSEDEITLYKNGGGAHLDLMVANYMIDRVEQEA